MKLRITSLILLSLTLLFLTSCETKPSTADREPQQPSLNTEKRAVMDTSKMKKRDGVPVIPTPGAQIDKNKVDAMLEEVNMSFSSIANAKATKEDLKNNVEKLKQLLQEERVLDDKELQFIFHNMLGNVYFRLFTHSELKDYLNQAIEHADSAISIFENQPEYKADLADVYMLRSDTYFVKKEYDKAISLMKYLVEEYQEIGYGPYKNWYASHQVERLNNLARMDTLESDEIRKIEDYLAEIAEKYDNEVGITAQIALVERYVRKDNLGKIRAISESIKNRVESLNNPAFKKHKWEWFKTNMERVKNRKTQQSSQSPTNNH